MTIQRQNYKTQKEIGWSSRDQSCYSRENNKALASPKCAQCWQCGNITSFDELEETALGLRDLRAAFHCAFSWILAISVGSTLQISSNLITINNAANVSVIIYMLYSSKYSLRKGSACPWCWVCKTNSGTKFHTELQRIPLNSRGEGQKEDQTLHVDGRKQLHMSPNPGKLST